MTFSYVSFARPSNNSTVNNAEVAKDAAHNAVDYLNQEFSSHEHDFLTWDYGESGCDPAAYEKEREYAKACIEQLVDNDGMSPKENVVLPHSQVSWGYGYSLEHRYNGDLYAASSVYANSTFHVKKWAMRAMTWHEIGHSLAYGTNTLSEHGSGSYDVIQESGELKMDNITPMGTSYTYDQSGNVDTGYEGGSTPPEYFCEDRLNEAYDFATGNKESLHDYTRYSKCTLDKIETWMDRF